MSVTIRPVEAGDRAVWEALFDGYAAYYKTSVTAEGKGQSGGLGLGLWRLGDGHWRRFACGQKRYRGISIVERSKARHLYVCYVGIIHYRKDNDRV